MIVSECYSKYTFFASEKQGVTHQSLAKQMPVVDAFIWFLVLCRCIRAGGVPQGPLIFPSDGRFHFGFLGACSYIPGAKGVLSCPSF